MFAFGLAFQLPVAISLLARAGLVSAKGMKSKRKYAFVGAFGAAAILTPPDLISQIGLGIPIIILYEISIHLASIMERIRQTANEESDEGFNDENGNDKNNDDELSETDYDEE